MGVDGLRLDAIPYLIEREGTNCENLPETHGVIKQIRAALDARYPDRMLLAEANQWPEETAPYFGDGDECQMAFHFPLMPRMYMAIAQEDRHPITDIMRQTPEIPEGCQWAIFLRNHDELTLEMVTDKERDYLWSFYAAERRARINLGIRRRLAPLLENDRRKIELMNSLLFSMPGTPVLYYGDEIGMGDNIYLGDRDGVRTPMQWSPDRNGGFSRADPARLFLPAIQDPIYGFDAVNVEAQRRSPASLLNWMRRMIAIRRTHQALGRGSLRFLYPRTARSWPMCASTRARRILCVANVSRAPQAVELDLSDFKGRVPHRADRRRLFPADRRTALSPDAAGLRLLLVRACVRGRGGTLRPDAGARAVHARPHRRARHAAEGRERTAFERRSRRTSSRGGAGSATRRRRSRQSASLTSRRSRTGPARTPSSSRASRWSSAATSRQRYFVPLAVEEGREDEALMPYAVARVRRGRTMGLIYGAASSPEFGIALVDAMSAAPKHPRATASSASRGRASSTRTWSSIRPRCAGSAPSRATPRSPSARG